MSTNTVTPRPDAVRADFYVRYTDGLLKWMGSVETLGRPEDLPAAVRRAASVYDYCVALQLTTLNRADAHHPICGWPWFHPTSEHADFTYVFDDIAGVVEGYRFGFGPFDPNAPASVADDFPLRPWPDMTPYRNGREPISERVA